MDKSSVPRLKSADIDRVLGFLMCFMNMDSIEDFLRMSGDAEHKLGPANKKMLAKMRASVPETIAKTPELQADNVKAIADALVQHWNELIQSSKDLSVNKRRKLIEEGMWQMKREMVLSVDQHPRRAD